MEWINVLDNQPEINELVLVCNNESIDPKENWVCAGQINEDGLWYNQFQDHFSDVDIRPTHWMPLPEPPKV